MMSSVRRATWEDINVDDIFPDVLSADRAYLVSRDTSCQPCVFYFRKSVGDDFSTQILRCLQHARQANLRLDTTVGNQGVYFDDDKSASKDVERPGYDKLIADIISGTLTGRFVVVRDQDRLSRKELSVMEDYHVTTELCKVRTYDSTGREIKDDITTGVVAVLARAESRIIAQRQRARKELRAIEGKPPASRVRRIGYTHGYKQIVWEEAKILRRARKKAVAGQSLTGICAEMRRMGITRPNGKLYRTADLGRILRAPEYAALRSFSRDVEVEGVIIPKGQPVAKGNWPRIFTEDEHYEIVDVLSKNEPWVTDNSPKHLLTGILVCDECGTRMNRGHKYGKPHKDGTRKRQYIYRCERKRGGCGRVSRNQDALEHFILGLTYEAMRRLPVIKEKVIDTTAQEIARQEKKIADAKQAYKDDAIDIAEFVDIRQDAQKKIKELKKNREQIKRQPLPIDDAEAFINSNDVSKQRDTIRRFFPVVGVRPAGQGARFKPDQLVFPGTE